LDFCIISEEIFPTWKAPIKCQTGLSVKTFLRKKSPLTLIITFPEKKKRFILIQRFRIGNHIFFVNQAIEIRILIKVSNFLFNQYFTYIQFRQKVRIGIQIIGIISDGKEEFVRPLKLECNHVPF
jgi:hypothetical protein